MISYPPEVQDAIVLSQDRFAWEAPTRTHYDRGRMWYVVLTVVALLLIAYAVWTENFMFAFIVLISVIMLVLTGHEKGETALVQVGDAGVVLNGKLYLYRELDHFAIVYQPPYTKVLYIDHKNPVVPRLRLPLQETDPVELRDHLKQFLSEDMDLQEEHLSDIVARLLKI
ncbi:MAG: hypothetical protein Q7R83_04255 [bacterium]|nr:hypothetical protein [bacterium]